LKTVIICFEIPPNTDCLQKVEDYTVPSYKEVYPITSHKMFIIIRLHWQSSQAKEHWFASS